jgi:hypothetical protein
LKLLLLGHLSALDVIPLIGGVLVLDCPEYGLWLAVEFGEGAETRLGFLRKCGEELLSLSSSCWLAGRGFGHFLFAVPKFGSSSYASRIGWWLEAYHS